MEVTFHTLLTLQMGGSQLLDSRSGRYIPKRNHLVSFCTGQVRVTPAKTPNNKLNPELEFNLIQFWKWIFHQTECRDYTGISRSQGHICDDKLYHLTVWFINNLVRYHISYLTSNIPLKSQALRRRIHLS